MNYGPHRNILPDTTSKRGHLVFKIHLMRKKVHYIYQPKNKVSNSEIVVPI